MTHRYRLSMRGFEIEEIRDIIATSFPMLALNGDMSNEGLGGLMITSPSIHATARILQLRAAEMSELARLDTKDPAMNARRQRIAAKLYAEARFFKILADNRGWSGAKIMRMLADERY